MFVDRFELYQKYKNDSKKYVYLHVTQDTYEPFYVGCGRGRRAAATTGHNKKWHKTVKERGWLVYILADGLETEEAYNLEMRAIDEYQKRFPEINCNLSLGGAGGSYGIKQSEDWIRKRVASHGYKGLSERMLGNEYGKIQIELEELKRLKEKGMTTRALAKHFNCSIETIRRRLNSMR